jgi:hypothetical protein
VLSPLVEEVFELGGHNKSQGESQAIENWPLKKAEQAQTEGKQAQRSKA